MSTSIWLAQTGYSNKALYYDALLPCSLATNQLDLTSTYLSSHLSVLSRSPMAHLQWSDRTPVVDIYTPFVR